jgi:hypothetical protein
MKIKLYIIFLLFFINGCGGIDCDNLPNHYSSYAEAIDKIKAAHFKIEETCNTGTSSWIRGASFYSCDGITGFLIIKTDNQNYLHSGIPIKIWKEFQNTESYGSFYNRYIKHRYYFEINK